MNKWLWNKKKTIKINIDTFLFATFVIKPINSTFEIKGPYAVYFKEILMADGFPTESSSRIWIDEVTK